MICMIDWRLEEEKAVEAEAKKFMEDFSTRVFINENDDAGENLFAIQVKGDGFWLNAFKTEKEAVQFINANNLQLVE